MILDDIGQSQSDSLATPAAESSVGKEETPRSVLVEWANQQDAWIRALVSEVIETRAEVSEDRVQHFYDLLLREKELAAGDPVQVPALSADPGTLAQDEPMVINAVEALENVNLLSPNQTVEFNPCLTVLFGENASGKSGYVRVLKRVAAVRTAEPVLPDITDATAATCSPRARIRYTHGAQTQTLDWANESGIYPLTRIDVFDARCAPLHVDEDLTYVYTPGELALFPLVQQSIEKARSRLESRIRTANPTSNPFVASFDRGTAVYPKIESLGPATNLDELRALANVTDAEKEQLSSLQTEVEALRSQAPQAQLRLAENEKKLLETLKTALESIRGFNLPAYMAARGQLLGARERYESATSSAFADSEIPGVLREEWKQFILAGETFLRSIDAHEHYPQGGDQCIYCRQKLDERAVSLIRKYRDYCNNALRDDVSRAEEAVSGFAGILRELSLAEMEQQVKEHVDATRGNGAVSALSPVGAFLGGAQLLRSGVLAGEEFSWEELPAEAQRAFETVETELGKVSPLITTLKQRSEDRQEALKQRETRFAELRARLRLQALLPQIEDHVQRAQWANKAEVHSRRFQGIFRSLTEASKSASEKLLNQDFERRFNEECEKLRAPGVRLLFPGRQGQVTRRKSVSASHRLSETLSEGEQKAIALADFVAEVRLKTPAAPVVFDDPITSLDYKRMKEVAARIVEISRERQVIVFTHNIWFATQLLSHFEGEPQRCSYFDVQRDDTRVGIVTRGTHPRADTVSSLRGRINKLIQDAERATGET